MKVFPSPKFLLLLDGGPITGVKVVVPLLAAYVCGHAFVVVHLWGLHHPLFVGCQITCQHVL